MAKNLGNAGENEYHVVAVRLHVTGAGNFKMTLKDIDASQTQSLVDLPMTLTSGRIAAPTRLADFQSQRTCLRGEVTEINEHFRIHKIILFAKPVAVEYPS